MANTSKDKRDYLVQTLSRTNRKDYENYVINRIWNKLDDLEIKPMTQKYVKKQDGNYYLIDLYFPQFNLGVECDEDHPIKQREADRLMRQDITTELEGYEEKRIVIQNNLLDDINKWIDEIVALIKAKKSQAIKENKFKKWEIIEPNAYFSDKDKISIDDDVDFQKEVDALNVVFNLGYKVVRRGWFKIKNQQNVYAWFPQLAIEGHTYTHGWENTLSDDALTITQKSKKILGDKQLDDATRVVFMKIKDKITRKSAYKFVGVFKKETSCKGKETFKRIASEWKIER